MVLLVCHAFPHNYKAHLVDFPGGAHYVVYMLLLAGKHMIMPFSYTNCNMHISSMLRFRNYGTHRYSAVNKIFADFMSANMYQRLCPIQGQHVIGSSIFRQLTFMNSQHRKTSRLGSSHLALLRHVRTNIPYITGIFPSATNPGNHVRSYTIRNNSFIFFGDLLL